MRILVVEDEPVLRTQLAQAIAAAGHTVDCAADGAQAHYLGEVEAFDAVVLDLGLPVLDGLSVLRRWRAAGRNMPVIILTARSAWQEKVAGIDAGADDYLAKPCDPRELTARLRAVLRRSHPAAVSSQMELGDLCFSPMRGVVTIDQRDITLTVSESRILEALLRQPGEPLDKQELAQIALGRKLTLYDRSLDMHVSNLRKKIGPHPDGRPRIVALRSRGYYYSL